MELGLRLKAFFRGDSACNPGGIPCFCSPLPEFTEGGILQPLFKGLDSYLRKGGDLDAQLENLRGHRISVDPIGSRAANANCGQPHRARDAESCCFDCRGRSGEDSL